MGKKAARKIMRILPTGKSGFTLVEILVVLTLIGILAGMTIVGMGGTFSNSQVRTKAEQIYSLLKITQQYSVNNQRLCRIIINDTDHVIIAEEFVQEKEESDWKSIKYPLIKTLKLPTSISIHLKKETAENSEDDTQIEDENTILFSPTMDNTQIIIHVIGKHRGMTIVSGFIRGEIELKKGILTEFKNYRQDLDLED